ncbi:MAG: PorV/PorQ family protein [candidate division Zixibacteria bacterium]|nr:PorV/PorQ family protein [candidate division Zixibacteria bacterium]
MRRLLTGVIPLLFPLNAAFGASNNADVGTRVYPFLKNGVGARPLAMGGAFTGLADDESALYYNPAGATQVRTRALAASYVNYFGDVNSGYLAFLYPVGQTQTAGAALNYFNYGEFVGLDAVGNPTENFTPSDLAFQLTYARQFKAGFSLGLSGKIIYEKLQDYSSSALAADAGFLYNFKNGRGRVGLVLQNLGFQISRFWGAPKEDLPAAVKIGGSVHPVGLPMNVTLDIGFPTDNDPFVSGGVEYLKLNPAFLRAGYTTFGKNYKAGLESGKDNLAGFSGGFGVLVKKFHIDYAFLPYSTLGSVHRFSGAYRF